MSTQPEQTAMPPVKIAFVLDDRVVDVLHTDDRLASIFLSEPKILDVTQWMLDNPGKELVGLDYVDTTTDGVTSYLFTSPEADK